MSSFINKMIARHLHPTQKVRPRLRARFEDVRQASGQVEVAHGREIHETVTENPILDINTDLTGNSDNRDRDQPSFTIRPDFTIDDHSDITSRINNAWASKRSIAKPFEEENSNPKIPENGTLASQPSEHDPDLTFSVKADRIVSSEYQRISGDVAPGLPSKNQNFQSGRPTLDEPDFDRTKNSGSNRLTLDHGSENNLFQPSKWQKEKTEIGPSEWGQSNSLIGLGQNGDIPDLKQFPGPILNTPEQPIIKVSIGRINIRAQAQKATPVKRTRQTDSKPRMSLDDYLKKQNDPSR